MCDSCITPNPRHKLETSLKEIFASLDPATNQLVICIITKQTVFMDLLYNAVTLTSAEKLYRKRVTELISWLGGGFTLCDAVNP
jgi:hypothetical protein